MNVLGPETPTRSSLLRPTVAQDLRPTVSDLRPRDTRRIPIKSLVIGPDPDEPSRATHAVLKTTAANVGAPGTSEFELRVARNGRWIAKVDVGRDGLTPEIPFVGKIGDDYQRIDSVKVSHHRLSRSWHKVAQAVGSVVSAHPLLSSGAIMWTAAVPLGILVAPLAFGIATAITAGLLGVKLSDFVFNRPTYY